MIFIICASLFRSYPEFQNSRKNSVLGLANAKFKQLRDAKIILPQNKFSGLSLEIVKRYGAIFDISCFVNGQNFLFS